MNTDRYTKAVLSIIALGMWCIILKPVLFASAAFAQAKKPSAKPTPAPASIREYVAMVVDDEGVMRFGGAGTIALSATGLGQALDAIPKAKGGWRLNSVVPCVSGSGGSYMSSTGTSYVVIAER